MGSRECWRASGVVSYNWALGSRTHSDNIKRSDIHQALLGNVDSRGEGPQDRERKRDREKPLVADTF